MLRRRDGLPPDRGFEPPALREALRRGRAGGRALRPRLARRPDRRRDARADGAREPARHPAALRRARRVGYGRRRLRTEALCRPPPRREGRQPFGDSRARGLLRREPVAPDGRLQGNAERRPARGVLSGPPGRRARRLARDGPLALLDEHLPELVARPPLPLHLAQRRDQHAARKRQLDAGPAADVLLPPLRGRPDEGPPRHRRRGVGLRDVRQRPRASRPRRPVAAARPRDDDSRAMEQARVDEPGAEGVLRVPLLLHGAVGRARLDRLHGRPADRRRPRPERAPSLALARDEGRVRRHGLGGGRPRHPPREGAPEGAPPAGPDVPRRPRGRADRPRRRDQERPRERGPLRPLAGGAPRPAARPPRASRRHRARPRDGPPAAGDVRLHAGGRPARHRPDGRERDRADRLDGDRHSARRPLRAAAAPLRLLQAALRAGDEPAGRRGPRDDRHGRRYRDRPGGEPPRAEPGRGAPLRAADAGPPERRAGEDPLPRREGGVEGVPVDHPPDALQGPRRRQGAAQGDRGSPAPGERGDRRGAQHPDPLGPGTRRDRRADPGAPRAGRRAAPPAARRVADAGGARPRERRAARGPPLLPPDRLRRERDQPVPRLRDDPRPGPAGNPRGVRRGGREELRQGGEQGAREGHLQDGDLHGPELPRGAGLRGARPLAGLRRRVLHRDADTDRRHRY